MEAEIEKCVELLLQGKVILYPTDTIWGLGCDATNEEAVKKVFEIKHRIEGKSMLVLLDKSDRLPMYVKRIPLIAWGFHRLPVVDFGLLIVLGGFLHLLVRVAFVHFSTLGHQLHGVFAELFGRLELLVALADGRQFGFGLGLHGRHSHQ